jgi:Zn-dependent M32 family carboxypeptidase
MKLDMHGARVWAFNPFFSSGPIYIQSYAIAEMAAQQIHGYINASPELNRWDEATGNYLRTKYFSIAGRMTLDEILVAGTGEKLTPAYTISYANGKGAKTTTKANVR